MKRSTFMKAVHEFAGPYIIAGFKGENPAAATEQSRYLLEVAMERYIQHHQMYTLCKVEDPTWTVFHTNLHQEKLKKAREQYLGRQGITRFMNIGYSDAPPIPANAMYYGQPPIGMMKKLRIALGKSPVGSYWRELKQKFLPRASAFE